MMVSPVSAADGSCQLVESTTGPPRQILRCPSGPVVEAETKANVHVIDPGAQGNPTGAKVDVGAALVDIPEGYAGGFQISTPRAVASVRGTSWVVDVSPARTSVFVIRGEVSVRRVDGGASVVLKKGQGVDVGSGSLPLRASLWPPKRKAALLARFGR